MAALPGSGGDVLGWAFGDELRYFPEVCEDALLTRDVDELVEVRVYSFSINISISRSLALTSGSARDRATPSDYAMVPMQCLASSTSTRPPANMPSIPLHFPTLAAAHHLCRVVCFDRSSEHTSERGVAAGLLRTLLTFPALAATISLPRRLPPRLRTALMGLVPPAVRMRSAGP